MKKVVVRVLLMIVLFILALTFVFFFSKTVVVATVGNFVKSHVSVEGNISADALMNLIAGAVTSLLAGIGAVIKWCFKKDPDIPIYIVISSDSDYPYPLSGIKSNRNEAKKNTVDINLAKRKYKVKFRYIYAIVKNTGDSVIEKCIIARRQLPGALNPHSEYKIRFIFPEPIFFSNLRHKRKKKISYRLEGGNSSKFIGKYKVIVDVNDGTVDFENMRTA